MAQPHQEQEKTPSACDYSQTVHVLRTWNWTMILFVLPSLHFISLSYPWQEGWQEDTSSRGMHWRGPVSLPPQRVKDCGEVAWRAGRFPI